MNLNSIRRINQKLIAKISKRNIKLPKFKVLQIYVVQVKVEISKCIMIHLFIKVWYF